jgi:hypothetical protein
MRKGPAVTSAALALTLVSLLPVPAYSQIATEEANLAEPPGQQKPKAPAQPTPQESVI